MSREEEILRSYLRASHEVSHQFRNHYGKLNLTFPQAMVLSLLDMEGPLPISTLAESTGSANSTISGVVDRLTKMGYVRRRKSEDDHRIIFVELTDQYVEWRSRAKTNVMDFFSELIHDVSISDQDRILEGLDILADALTKKRESEEADSN